MSNKRLGFKESLRILVRGYRIIAGFEKYMLLSSVLSSIFTALYPFINIYLSAQIINELISNRDPQNLLWLVGITIGANLLCYMIKSGLNRWNEAKGHLFWWNTAYHVSEKLRHMDYIDLEDREIRDKYDTIRMHHNGMGYGINRLYGGIEQIVSSLTQIITSVTLACGLFSLPVVLDPLLWLNHWWVNLLAILLIVVPIVCSAYIGKRIAMVYANASDGNNDSNRYFRYICGELVERSKQRDIRLYDQKLDKKRLDDLLIKFIQMDKKVACINGARVAVDYLFHGLIYLFAALKALGGAFGIGSVVQYVSSVTQFIAGVSGLVGQVNEWKANLPYLKNVVDFVDIPNKKYLGSLSVEQRDDNEYEIEFRDVSFRYPGSEEYALKHLNLKFKIGERMAVVGENGSGKSTMIKLLCRLYDPTEGKITLNGIDIKKYNYDQYMTIFGVVFQDFSLLPFTLGENVAASKQYDRKRVTECLKKAGFGEKLAEWKQGLDTYLYTTFSEEGVNISGGEAQKIALARALYKDAPFIVLDEPTAALDPVSEYEIYSKFNDIVEDKTAIYISHRLSSCRFCSDITVFDKGELIQRGSHEALLSDTDGKYYALWNAQAQYYQT